MNPLIVAPTNYEWFSFAEQANHPLHTGTFGTRHTVASVLLAIPGVAEVGLADCRNDQRIKPGRVKVWVKFHTRSMSDRPLTESEMRLVLETINVALWENLPAVVMHELTVEPVE